MQNRLREGNSLSKSYKLHDVLGDGNIAYFMKYVLLYLIIIFHEISDCPLTAHFLCTVVVDYLRTDASSLDLSLLSFPIGMEEEKKNT